MIKYECLLLLVSIICLGLVHILGNDDKEKDILHHAKENNRENCRGGMPKFGRENAPITWSSKTHYQKFMAYN